MVILAALWIIWCILHSLLISRAAHTIVQRLFPDHYSMYRLFYVCFSIFSLILVLLYQFSLPQQVLITDNLAIRIGQLFLLLYAGFMFWAGSRVYDIGYFLGLVQWRNRSSTSTSEGFPFHTDGILAYIRHPWYSGGIALLWGFGTVSDVYLLTRIILTVYILIGTLLEEKRLKTELGNRYREYCKQVPMLIPWKILKGKASS